MGKGKTTEQVGVMNKARVREIRRRRREEPRKQGISHYDYLRKSHQKRFALMKQREPQLYQHLRTAKPVKGRRPAFTPTTQTTPTPRYATGTSHVGRSTHKHFIVPKTFPRQVVWFKDLDEQRRYTKKMLRGLL